MRKRSSVASIRCSICGTGSLVGRLRQLGDVVALVAVLGRLLAAPDAPRPTRGSAPSARRRRCSSTRARPRCPANSSRRATESPYAPFRAEATVIGPVGLAETISTCTVSRLLGRAAAVARPGGEDLGQRLAEPRRRQPEVDEARARDLRALDLVQRRGALGELLARARAAAGAAPARAAARRWSRSRRARDRSAARARPALPRAPTAAPRGVRRSQRKASRRREQLLEQRAAPRVCRRRSSRRRRRSVASGSGVVSKVPSPLRSATIIAPVCWRMRRSRIDLPASRHESCDLDLLEQQLGPAARRDDVEERGHLRLQDELRHLRARASSTAARPGRRRRGAASRSRPRRRRARRSAGRAARCGPRA